jgi:hypothetical protein
VLRLWRWITINDASIDTSADASTDASSNASTNACAYAGALGRVRWLGDSNLLQCRTDSLRRE